MGNKKSKNKATTTWGNCFNVTKKTKPERNSHFYTEGYLSVIGLDSSDRPKE